MSNPFSTNTLEHIAKITAHIRDVAENKKPEEAISQIHGLTLMIDGLLVGAGLPINFPDYGLEKTINEPDYEVKARDKELDEQAILDELHIRFGLTKRDVKALQSTMKNTSLDILLSEIEELNNTGDLDEWLDNAHQWLAQREAIHPSEEDTREIENILRKQ